MKNKNLNIDFLFLDLNTCERCISTDSSLDEAVSDLNGILTTLGYSITVNKLNITSTEMAEKYNFVSSPTILVNGKDICMEVKENNCKSCGDICGSDVDCRVFVYEDEEYEQPPKAMIIDGILRSIFSATPKLNKKTYKLPENLNNFFSGQKSSCCDSNCDCND